MDTSTQNRKKHLRWMRLDNAAKIYPAARQENWSNVFRLSVSLTQPVDPAVLQKALDVTVPRFPSMAARLRKGVFWYYLEQIAQAPPLKKECCYPLTFMSREEISRCAFRVILYGNRIALEMFHSLTDGNGALVFLKTLLAEYLQQKYGLQILPQKDILDRQEDPQPEELEDSFLKYAGSLNASRRENNAWHLRGEPEEDGFLHVTCMELSVEQVLAKAHEHHVTLTAFLCAVMIAAIQKLQQQKVPEVRRRKPIRVLVPVNLRKLFPSRTLRNFAMYATPEILPALGEYTFQEICQEVKHRMGVEITPKQLSMKIATNVAAEKLMAVKLMPLFIKNIVMKLVFKSVGERKTCLSLSNLGAVQVPEQMKPYIARFDFILGVQATAPYNCGILSWQDTLYINFIRNTKQPELEQCFYQVLQALDLPVQVQSNNRKEV